MKQRRVSYAKMQRLQQQQLIVPPSHHFYDPEWSQSQMCSSNSSSSFSSSSGNKFSSETVVTNFNNFNNNCNSNFGKLTSYSTHQRFGRPSGKGRFGKRPPTGNHQPNDNSNDSGFGCDSNSESQFWLSSDDSRSHGGSSNLIAAFPVAIPSFQNQSLTEKYIQAKKLQDNFEVQKTETFAQPKVESISSVPTFTDDTSTSDMLFKKVETNSENSAGYIIPEFKNIPISSVPIKRPRYTIQNNKGANSLKIKNQNQNGTVGRTTIGKRFPLGAPASLSSPISSTSQDGSVQLQILTEPEEQHRARYQTEGSRGAIKDRKGNGFPAVKLVGYNKAATLQIFIGSDQGKVQPHMFYQVCKVTGKSSTPCVEKKIEGTIVIEIDFEPSKEMVISCDCVGILKERNVDVEQRFPFHHSAASRKKSTKCRLIFRTTIINNDGIEETLQATSLPIVCTQPPGQPEISKKSHVGCPAKGGLELIVIGKNFLKDTKVIIQEESLRGDILWEIRAEIQKDYLQQVNHFVCVIPPYKDETITKPVECRLIISSGGRTSEPQRFMYIPNQSAAYYEFLEGVSHDINVSLPPFSLPCSVRSPILQHQISREEILISHDSLLNGISKAEVLPESLLTTETTPSTTLSSIETVPITLSYESSLSPPTTAQEARQVVNELQSLLDKSVHNLVTRDLEVLQCTNQPPISVGLTASSYMDSNLKRSLGLEPSPFIQPTTTVSTLPMQLGFIASEPSQTQNFPEDGSPLTCTTVSQTTTLPQLMDTISGIGTQDLLANNLICQSSTGSFPTQLLQNDPMVGGMPPLDPIMDSPIVANCLTNLLMKVEPTSPVANSNAGAVVTTAQSTSSDSSFLSQQGCIAQVTEMSDNELLSYINPSCFEQEIKN